MSDETITDSTGHFLSSAEISDAARAIFDEDIA